MIDSIMELSIGFNNLNFEKDQSGVIICSIWYYQTV
jgi:hypothetical protein